MVRYPRPAAPRDHDRGRIGGGQAPDVFGTATRPGKRLSSEGRRKRHGWRYVPAARRHLGFARLGLFAGCAAPSSLVYCAATGLVGTQPVFAAGDDLTTKVSRGCCLTRRSNPNRACLEPSSRSCWKERVLLERQRGQVCIFRPMKSSPGPSSKNNDLMAS